ncbi:MAG: HD domain-containing protein [Treponema sp.]|jgi:HD superfamily phosphohydrolase|nr:HD domain-containing protein [Treponema sp.]
MTVRSCLQEGFTNPLRDTLWGHIYLTPALAALTNSAPFMRLYRIFQLGPVYRVYPGATHTRAGHSIGVYHLGRRLLRNLVDRGAEDWLSPGGARSFLCACLLHDLGHFPYAHSLKELPLESHEALTGKLILSEPVKSLVGDCGADPFLTAAIVDGALPGADTGEAGFYRKLLSGVLDPDKLDYLNRDARYCGVPYGAQDVDFILSQLYPHPLRGVDIDSRGIPSVESILFSKYLMYRTVYWHHSARSATAMIKKALIDTLNQGRLRGEELYNLDDQSLFALMERRAGPLSSLAAQVKEGPLFSMAAEFPFDTQRHQPLLDIGERLRREEALAAELSAALNREIPAGELIIDLPEPFSLDTALYVRNEERCFARSSSAFNGDTAQSFVKSLYMVRVFIHPRHKDTIKTRGGFDDVLQLSEKWLE